MSYRYIGEYTGDYNELLYLRARYYAPSIGRFLTKDIWDGDVNRPLSFHQWMYVEGNPINRTDPSGMCYTDPNVFSSGYWKRFFEKPILGPCSSSCTGQQNDSSEECGLDLPTPASVTADPSDCRNLTDWFGKELYNLATQVHKDFSNFLNVVGPNQDADWRQKLLQRDWGGAIMFCWNSMNCEFYDVSTPGNIVYGYLGAQVGISRQILHDVASLGQFNDEVYRRIGVSNLPPGLDDEVEISGFDSLGDFNAIELGYDMYKPGIWPTTDDFKSALNTYHLDLEIVKPTIPYVSVEDWWFTSPGCGQNPP